MQETEPIQIDFYHLKSTDIASPLAMLSHKAVSSGQKMLILARAEQYDAISTALWVNRPESFLAHDIDEGEGADHAPVWVSTRPDENPINAPFIALTCGMVPTDLTRYRRIFNLFDGGDAQALQIARQCWKDWSVDAGFQCRYFAQDEEGQWSLRK